MILMTRFLERKWVIQLFGLALIIAPFANFLIQFLVINKQNSVSFRFVNVSKYILSGSMTNYTLAIGSLVIGAIMLSGSKKAWKAVLVLVGAHLFMQVFNYKSKEWNGPLGWTAFIVNLSVFLFIADQLVWRVTQAIAPSPAKVIHLKSYKKILFGFDSDRPWGRLTTLTSQQLIVTCFDEAPASIENKVVQIKFTKDLVVDIKFHHKESNLYYFTPLNMSPDRVLELNQWLKKIAV